MALLRLMTALLFYIVAIFAGLARTLLYRIGIDAIDLADHVSGKSDSTRVRDIAEEWKHTNDRME